MRWTRSSNKAFVWDFGDEEIEVLGLADGFGRSTKAQEDGGDAMGKVHIKEDEDGEKCRMLKRLRPLFYVLHNDIKVEEW